MASIQSVGSVIRRSLRIPREGFDSRVRASRLSAPEKTHLVRSGEALEGLVGLGLAAQVARFNSVLVGLRPGGQAGRGQPRDRPQLQGLAQRMREVSARRAFIQQRIQLNTDRIAALGRELETLRQGDGAGQATGRLALEA